VAVVCRHVGGEMGDCPTRTDDLRCMLARRGERATPNPQGLNSCSWLSRIVLVHAHRPSPAMDWDSCIVGGEM